MAVWSVFRSFGKPESVGPVLSLAKALGAAYHLTTRRRAFRRNGDMIEMLCAPQVSGYQPDEIGLIIVDHGSRRRESNVMLIEVVKLFREMADYRIVEAAHMELAEPSIATAFDRCVSQGARLVVIHPYFLLPGKHWNQDIPALAGAAAAEHQGVRFLVTAPLGLHELMVRIMDDRIKHCLACAEDKAEPCPVCRDSGGCAFRGALAAG
jgi:hypothetical protein